MTRVLVDLLFYTGKKGGMESYVRRLYGAIASARESLAPDLEFVGYGSTELAALDTSWFPGTIVQSGISGENRAAWARGELLSVSRAARNYRADLIHCPANLGPVRSKVPVVTTIHDLLPFRFPEYVPGPYAIVLQSMIRFAARSSSRVITVSEASAVDITRFLRVPAGRITVVPLGAETVTNTVDPSSRDTTRILCVGNRMPHKNADLLLEALAIIPADERPTLTLTGSSENDPLLPLIRDRGLEPWVDLRQWVSDEELDELYKRAGAVVFPTLFEGFGLPVLEAMTRGCPVLCSDIPVLHEVAADAARYFDPRDSTALAAAIVRVLGSDDETARLSQLGVDRAAQFSWSLAAERTVQAFRLAL